MFVDLFPWYLWIIWGGLGSIYLIRWVIISTKGDPVLWRICWFVITIMGIVVAVEAMIKGTGLFSEYMPVIDFISKPLLILTAILFFIGGYQKSKYFDSDKQRRMQLLLIIFAISCIIFAIMILALQR